MGLFYFESKFIIKLFRIFALFNVILYNMPNGTNIRIDNDVHKSLIEHLKNTEKKIGKWTEIAIKEKINKESKQPTQPS